MKKVYRLEDLDCAHCAGLMTEKIKKIPGVKDANINFLAQKLTIETDEEDISKIMKEAVKICKKIEPDCTILM